MTTEKNIKDLFNATAYDRNGDKLGSIKEVFVDDNTGQPTFIEVGHGLFGMASSLVPMRGHRLSGDELKLAFDKDRIKDAPNLDADEHLTPEDQRRIYEHYRLTDARDEERYASDDRRDRDHGRREAAAGAGAGAGAGLGAAGERAESRPGQVHDHPDHGHRDHAGDDAMIRSEERLNVDKQNVETGEVRLRKHVVTDTETVEVPVTREEVRVEREPITDADARDLSGRDAAIGEDEASVTLHEERVNVSKESVPVEKVRLDKETVRDTETHTEEVRKEQIDADGLEGRDGRHAR
ncbi:PRC and DUF2382 domain-containing protein [Corynebacterium hansenii]|uniref:PRC and DUF2382 domain-containing protein n=1 Tax=Corynebacterium hansenii TaxID=394964 RepID=A0ABV7ZPV1_9CORY|nr:PRC and DUF2382 domain-containing protein [Corynebacterium hansenii]WJZ00411.1 Stress response protein YsnF [Corynebacterium hansenii]